MTAEVTSWTDTCIQVTMADDVDASTLGTLHYPTSIVADGYLYTFAATNYDVENGDTYVFRRVHVEDTPHADKPASNTTAAKTGDSTRLLFIALGVIVVLALAGAICAFRRHRR